MKWNAALLPPVILLASVAAIVVFGIDREFSRAAMSVADAKDWLGFWGAVIGAGATIIAGVGAGWAAWKAAMAQIESNNQQARREREVALDLAEAYCNDVQGLCSAIQKHVYENLCRKNSIETLASGEVRKHVRNAEWYVANKAAVVARSHMDVVRYGLPREVWVDISSLMAYRDRLEANIADIKKLASRQDRIDRPIPDSGAIAQNLKVARKLAETTKNELRKRRSQM